VFATLGECFTQPQVLKRSGPRRGRADFLTRPSAAGKDWPAVARVLAKPYPTASLGPVPPVAKGTRPSADSGKSGPFRIYPKA